MNNKLIAGIAIVAVLVLVLVLVGGRSDDNAMNSSTPTTSPTVSPSGSAAPSASSPASATKAPGAATLSYQQALTRYAGTRLQFDDSCQVRPTSMSVKNGTTLMLDNRSATARTISIGTVKYAVAGYGFRIVTASSKTLPTELLIDCGAAQNVGRILLQK